MTGFNCAFAYLSHMIILVYSRKKQVLRVVLQLSLPGQVLAKRAHGWFQLLENSARIYNAALTISFHAKFPSARALVPRGPTLGSS